MWVASDCAMFMTETSTPFNKANAPREDEGVFVDEETYLLSVADRMVHRHPAHGCRRGSSVEVSAGDHADMETIKLTGHSRASSELF